MTELQSVEGMGLPGLPETEYCQVGDYRVPFVEYGTPSKEPSIVALNGISMPVTWGDLAEALVERGHHVVSVGVPKGPNMPRHPDMRWYVENTRAAIDEVLGDDEEYDILAQSWGGYRAQETAISDPRVRRSVLAVSSPKFWTPPVDKPNLRALWAVNSSKRDPKTIATIMGGTFGEDQATLDKLVALTEREIDPDEHKRQVGAAGLAIASGFMDIYQLRKRKNEILFVLGEKDPVIPNRGARLGAWIMGAKAVTIKGAGHGVVYTHTEQVADLANEFYTAA